MHNFVHSNKNLYFEPLQPAQAFFFIVFYLIYLNTVKAIDKEGNAFKNLKVIFPQYSYYCFKNKNKLQEIDSLELVDKCGKEISRHCINELLKAKN